MTVELTILVDNSAAEGLRAEHGLAILIRGPGRCILFDAAAGEEALLHNAAALGVGWDSVRGVVVSHGHCDHTGALAALASLRQGLEIHCHPGAFARRWVDRPPNPMREISCPHSLRKLQQAGAVPRMASAPELLEEWLLLSGPVGGPGGGCEHFVIRKGDDMVVDCFEDEMFLLVRGRKGWTLISGCCHRGLKNTLRTGRFLTRGEPIAAVVGGLHLSDADPQHLQEAAELLEANGVAEVFPCHCSGDKAIQFLRKHFPGQVHAVAAGTRIDI